MYKPKIKTSLVPPLDCLHTATCLPDYWGGHHKAHISIPVYRGMTLGEIKRALHAELNEGAVAGNDDRTLDTSGDIGDTWFYRAHAAVSAMKPTKPGARRFFLDLEPEDEDTDCSVYAYFVFDDRVY